MRTRNKSFLDIDRLKEVFSFQIFWRGKWMFVSDGKGGLLKFASEKDRDAARAEYRKKPTEEVPHD